MTGYAKFYFKPATGELIETVVHTENDKRTAICGTVLDKDENPVENALVLLFKPLDGKEELIFRIFTDKSGYFVFGPLESEVLYLIKIYKNSVKLRELEIRTD